MVRSVVALLSLGLCVQLAFGGSGGPLHFCDDHDHAAFDFGVFAEPELEVENHPHFAPPEEHCDCADLRVPWALTKSALTSGAAAQDGLPKVISVRLLDALLPGEPCGLFAPRSRSLPPPDSGAAKAPFVRLLI